MKKEKLFLEYSADQYHSTFKKGWDNLYEKKREYLFKELVAGVFYLHHHF